MNKNSTPIVSDLVLLGGGHANIQVLKMLAMNPIGGLRITLISDQTHSPYSGMIPGYLAGYYSYEDCHFDLRRICEELGQRFIKAKITGIDPLLKKIQLENRPEISYDCASINVGIEPESIENSSPEAALKLIPLKPISRFIAHWDRLIADLNAYKGSDMLQIAVVGAGASGVEISIILKMLIDQNQWNAEVSLIHRHEFLVSAKDHSAQRRLSNTLKNLDISVFKNTQALKKQEKGLLLKDEQGRVQTKDFFRVLTATQAAAPHWFKHAGLPTNPNGFLKVTEKLLVENETALFAAGDCIHFSPSPLKKAGVYAVRQGMLLEHNIRAFFTGKSALKTFHPKKNVLSLITIGERQALVHQDSASILRWMWPSLLWTVKDGIDRRFMKRFQARTFTRKPQQVDKLMPAPKTTLVPEDWESNTCGGCGSKLAASTLMLSLNKLDIPDDDAVSLGVKDGEDCALTRFSEHRLCLQSIDQFRSFISDPYLLGQIATQHALSDIYAMGGVAKTAQVGLTLGAANKKIHQEDIFQVMSGVLDILSNSGASLVGGHTGEGAELAIAIAVQGEVAPDQVLRKQLTQSGNSLILTKPIGTGVIFAANMLAQANGKLVDEALSSMLQSNKTAMEVLKCFDVSGCTDITGFGLLGHAFEMLRINSAGTLGIKIDYKAIPVFDGIGELFAKGYYASIAHKNYESLSSALSSEVSNQQFPALFDPQTSGGLLFSVPTHQTEECLKTLHQQGVAKACVIGEVIDQNKIIII
ncbi:selenide, water dikinase SelD [Methylicorpusculum oleiharenae]|uniref:selenide, water dikinase SelD n=1 Tax=Methylicorpusculum oleiharenae TaxID=1338687 RepID=UPI00135C1662|nr:selenide, water dikinase SelD [Methylicorpusculum oleiharenae]MCD2451579.1 selenide, water dikinase SelD [Methylicorpusculum oleiharenae]